jgi:hypothetical protein
MRRRRPSPPPVEALHECSHRGDAGIPGRVVSLVVQGTGRREDHRDMRTPDLRLAVVAGVELNDACTEPRARKAGAMTTSTAAADHLLEADVRRILHSHLPASIAGRAIMVEGKGCRLADAGGRSHLDATGGLWLAQIGHGREEGRPVACAIAMQTSKSSNAKIFSAVAGLLRRAPRRRSHMRCSMAFEASRALRPRNAPTPKSPSLGTHRIALPSRAAVARLRPVRPTHVWR